MNYMWAVFAPRYFNRNLVAKDVLYRLSVSVEDSLGNKVQIAAFQHGVVSKHKREHPPLPNALTIGPGTAGVCCKTF